MRPRSSALLAEFIGTAMLLCAVVGSGIMGERLSSGNAAIALLANTFATVFALYVLIETLGPVSGAHFNPLVTLLLVPRVRTALPIIAVQLLGAVAGTWLAHAMFGLDIIQASHKPRSEPGLWLAEAIATAALVFVILRAPPGKAAPLIACTIGAAYWFTSSTSFANPAAVLGRMLSDSFAGIAPASAFAFILAQCLGAWLGWRFHLALGKPGANRETP